MISSNLPAIQTLRVRLTTKNPPGGASVTWLRQATFLLLLPFDEVAAATAVTSHVVRSACEAHLLLAPQARDTPDTGWWKKPQASTVVVASGARAARIQHAAILGVNLDRHVRDGPAIDPRPCGRFLDWNWTTMVTIGLRVLRVVTELKFTVRGNERSLEEGEGLKSANL